MVTPGLTTGLEEVEVNPDGIELHLYEFPATDAAPSWVVEFRQMVLLAPATAAGNGFTVTTTLLLFEHPVAVIVSTSV